MFENQEKILIGLECSRMLGFWIGPDCENGTVQDGKIFE